MTLEEDVLSDNALVDEFVNFFSMFTNEEGDYYNVRINALNAENRTLIVRSDHLFNTHRFDFMHYFFSNKKVDFYLKKLSEAVRNTYQQFHPEVTEDFPLQELGVRLSIDDPHLVTKMRRLNISHRGKLTVIDSIITSKSEVKNTVREKVFKCSQCNQVYLKKVGKCFNEDCGKNTITLSVADSVWTDCEFLELQERHVDLQSSSAIPIKINARVYGDLVGRFKAGDNVRATGIIKMQKTVSDAAINAIQDDEFSSDVLFDRVMEVHNLELLATSDNLTIDNPDKYLTDKDITEIHKLRKRHSDDKEFLEVLVNSFAPHIYGHSKVKEAILLQRVGSVELVRGEQKTKKNINILLVGDPGVYKTKLLEAAKRLSPNGHMASGKGVSGVGLTAAVAYEGGVAKLSIGVVPLAHNGHMSLDEFSNVREEDKPYLLDCMESGTFRVNKGGINTMVNADATFLVATNPDSGKYNRFNTLFDNLTITDQLFSRFHIVFVMPDIVKREDDERMALHIMSTYDPSVVSKHPTTQKDDHIREAEKTRISPDLLFKYLLYANTHNTSDITIEKGAMDIFLDFYNEIRTPQVSSDITATPRQFVGMLMFAIARCRLMLRSVVTELDATLTVQLLSYAYHSCGMIVNETGGLNLTMEYSKPLDKVNKKIAFSMVVEKLTDNNTKGVKRDDIIIELINKAKWIHSEAQEFFDKMYDAGKMLRDANGNYILTD